MPLGVRQVGTFELPIHEVCKTISKFSILITAINEVEQALSDALKYCVFGRPGPAVINFPLDIQGALMSPNNYRNNVDIFDLNSKMPEKSSEFLNNLVLALKKSTCPAVMVGHGVRVSGMAKQVLQLLRELNLPVFTTQLAKDFIPYSDDLFIGHVGVRGDRPGNIGIHQADLILFIGTSLHQQNIGYEPHLFAPSANKFIVEFEGSVSGKNLPIEANYLDMDINVFVKEFGRQISGYVNSNSSWLNSLLELKYRHPVSKEMHNYTTTQINMYEFVEKLSSILEGGETVITDAGLCFYVMGQAFKLKQHQRYIVSGGLGSMGYALPAAIGASINPIGSVIAVTGDGSMQMNVQELATLKLLGTNTKIFVLNNLGYASIRNTQKSFFGDEFIGSSDSSGLSMPNWSLISESYGIDYVSIEDSLELAESLPIILSKENTQLIEVFCQRDQVVMPGTGNYEDEYGKLRSRPLDEMIPNITEVMDSSKLVIN
jgi:acetolactate synthase-1/2/3 large subunit